MRQTASRLLWFIGIWAGGVLLVGTIGYAIRLILIG